MPSYKGHAINTQIMNRVLILLVIFLQIAWSCKKESNNLNSACKSRFFYDSSGNKLPVNEIFNKGVISFYDTLSFDSIINILKQYGKIHFTDSSRNSFIIVYIDSKSCSSTDSIFTAIIKESKVSNCSKFMNSPQNNEIGIYDIFMCTLKDETSANHLSELLIKTNTRIVGFSTDLDCYFIRADKNSKGDALDMANEFYESGYFKWAQPNFILQLVPSTNSMHSKIPDLR